ncbi:uncharacterized membrane protein HdeD (DUF308 family) [Ornithinimicrobium humiphilum]|uniref:Uncharacterized membrane protein HdeD (DUF308 family) n=1 Tax=Ornithinimicrobium humiphilum TaxID=125288 RepID=A0A543K7W5_9MICO|nr:uncharacterized membrane protein HdeD (DUF308 family) [Ornithinimicrobium humiphilum]
MGARRSRGWLRAVPDRWPPAVRVLVGVLLVATGTVLALRPFRSLAVLFVLLVGALVLSGVGDLLRGRRPWGVLRGLVQLVAALALLLWPGPGLGVLTLVVAATLVVDGSLGLAQGWRSRGADRWATLLGSGALVVVGVLALLWRDVTLLVLAVAFGVRLVVQGFRLVRRRTAGPPGAARPARRLTGAVLAVVGALLLATVGVLVQRGHPQPDGFYAVPAEVPAEPGRLLRAEPFDRKVPAGARAWRILYTTTRDDGIPAVASGLVVVPTGADGPAPVVAWAHGTTGWAPGCAPSVLDEPFEAGALFALEDVVDRGWALVASDYVGLGTESPHPYVIGQGEGRSVLDALRAAREVADEMPDGVTLDDRTVVWGHSQGGHAALWTGALAPTYAPELRLDGVAALAPASNLEALVQVIEESAVGALFAVYVVQAYASVYDDVRLGDYVRPGAQLLVREMAQRCLSERGVLVSAGQALLLDRPVWDRDPTSGPFGRRLAENVPPGPISVPLLVGQGEADTLIAPAAQQEWVRARCAEGQQVDYRTYPGRDHLSLVAADSPATAELLAWTAERFEGVPAGGPARQDRCADLH